MHTKCTYLIWQNVTLHGQQSSILSKIQILLTTQNVAKYLRNDQRSISQLKFPRTFTVFHQSECY